MADSGPPTDSGPLADSGDVIDSGPPTDSGPLADSGSAGDSGFLADAGPAPDAGHVTDATTPDATTNPDAATPDAATPDAAANPDAATPGDAGVCGEPGRYAGCNSRLSMADCVAQAGRWGRWGLAPFDSCLCPTGDDGCPCTDSDQCDGSCIATIPAGGDCGALTMGMCSPTRPTFGCFCFFSNGSAAGLCVD